MKVYHLIIALAAMVLSACHQARDEKVILPQGDISFPISSSEVPTQSTVNNTQLSRSCEPKILKDQKPDKTPSSFVPRIPGNRISRVSVPGRYVALTFDDGPSATLTPQVLDILNRHGARGTFFVVGQNASRNPSILARAAAEGHEIGSHTYSHIKMTGREMGNVRSEIERTSSIIERATGTCPRVMRPPYGATNSRLVSMMVDEYGMKSVLWDVDTRDWQHPGVDVVVQRAVGGAKPGSIILVHDIHQSTLQALEGIVSGLQARGFTLVTVSQLIELGRHAAGEKTVAPVQPTAAARVFDTPAAAQEKVKYSLGGDGSASITGSATVKTPNSAATPSVESSQI